MSAPASVPAPPGTVHQSIKYSRLRQRADYTHKFNAKAGRHGWLRLTPAYSVKVVEEIIERRQDSKTVLDPFCGTGTTALSAVNHGCEATTVDINPFLTWLTRAKTASYSATALSKAAEAGRDALDLVAQGTLEAAPEPPIYNIKRWWTDSARHFLCRLKAALWHVVDNAEPASDLLRVAFCRTLIRLSNAAFNHQSMSFKSNEQGKLGFEPEAATVFLDELDFILASAAENPSGAASVILGDARNLPACVDAEFDAVITSPPYANRMSYIRELRPYMYWLGYLMNGADAGELDWLAIGGTWGVATSRLAKWQANDARWTPGDLPALLANIARNGNKNGTLLANYVAKYCEDMSLHFDGLRRTLKPGARLHYIVGNSTFYGVLVPVEQIYAAMMRKYGFTQIKTRALRKRNSKKELREFDVSAIWPGPGASVGGARVSA